MPGYDASAPSIADEPRQTGRGSLFGAALRQVPARIEMLFDRERDQLPLWLPVGLGLGIAAWFGLPDRAAWIAFLCIAAGLTLAALAAAPGTRWARAVAIFALAAAFGCALVWLRAERAEGPRLGHERMAAFTATVESVQRLAARQTVRLVVRPAPDAGLPSRLRINLDEDKADPAIAPGAVLKLKAWLMPPAPMAVPGAYDFARAAWFQRIGATGRSPGKVTILAPAHAEGWRGHLDQWRRELSDHIRDRLDGGAGGIAVALVTGDQGGISEEDADAMRRSGLAHLLSVSGLHLTAVVGAVMLLTLKLLALSPRLALRWPLVLIAAGTGAAAGLAYTLLTGAEVPTVRSCVAALLILFGIGLGREAFTLRLLAVGALLVLLLWPESLVGPSFQLSFAAIAAIVSLHDHPRIRALLSRREEGWPARIGRAVLGLILTGLAVEVALAPIALYHFHKAGLYGALANIVAIPLTTFVIMPLEALALLLDGFGLGGPVWPFAGAALRLLLTLAHATAAAPGAVAIFPAMPTAAFALIVLGGLWLCLWRTKLRRLGLLPILIGTAWTAATPPPDLIVTGDGRHLAVRMASGGFAILRDRAGDYVRDMLSETGGSEEEMPALDEIPGATCNDDLCTFDIAKGGRRWRILATRSRYMVEYMPLRRACAGADIVVSERYLPESCVPHWLKVDRGLLARTGGIAISLKGPQIRTVRSPRSAHPWEIRTRRLRHVSPLVSRRP